MNALTISYVETEIDALAPQIAAVLPPDVPADKFRSVVLAAIRNNAELLRCDPQSLFNACLNAAQDGLMPDGREGAIVPRKGKAVWQPMIQGIYKRVKSSGSVAALSANVVYDGETFDVLLGDEDRIVHRRDMTKVAKGAEVAVYAIATLRDGSKEREVMTWDQVEAVRKSSAMPNSGPWTQWADEMARKTVVRRLAKRLPVIEPADEVLQRTIGRVDSLYDFGTAPADRPVIEHTEPDARDALNATVPLPKQVPLNKAAAAGMQRAPRVAEKTEAPQRKSWAQWAETLEIADRDTQDTAAIGRLIARAEVAEIVRLAQQGEPTPAKSRIMAAHRNLEERYLADPPQPPDEPEAEELPELEIVNGDKLAAG